MLEIQFQSLGWEGPLEKEMVAYPSILVENPKDREAWWATVHRVTKSWTQLRNCTHMHTLHTLLYPRELAKVKDTVIFPEGWGIWRR